VGKMVSTNSNFEKTKHRNSFDKLVENVTFKAEDISCLIDNLPVTVFRLSSKLSWGMDYISTNIEKLTGYSKMDFIDQKLSWSDIVFPEDIEIIDNAVKKAKKSKSSYQIEYRIKKADGSTAFVQEQAHLVCDDSGKLAYIAGVFLNLASEVKRREKSHGSVKEDERIQLEMLRSFVKSLSLGEIPEPITENYNDDLNQIKNNVNNCIEGLKGLVECNTILQRLGVNDLTKGVEGKYIGIYESMAEATNEVRDRLLKVTKQINDIAVGDTSQLMELKRVGKRSEQDHLLPAVIEAMENINLLIEDAGMLFRAAVEGKLDTRADVSKHHGEYRKIVEGVNGTLDAVIGPLNVAAEYVERISRGDIPKPITDNYNGDFNEIKNNLNTCIVAVNNLVADAVMLSEAGVAGRLDTRADATKHEGDFRRIVAGVNDTLDAVIGPLNVAAEYVERISRGDVPKPITDNYNGNSMRLRITSINVLGL
jgi:PAS domain S-box-containing protein